MQSNWIRNYSVTKKDADLAEKIFGPDMTSLKGKSVRRQLEQRIDGRIAFPKESIQTNSNMHMHIDVMQVNKVKFKSG